MPDPAAQNTAYDLVDELTPEGLDWERLVRAYPIPALLLAAAGGFLLGRTRGPEILAAVSGFASEELARNINDAIGREVF
jgi:hypothetical protein